MTRQETERRIQRIVKAIIAVFADNDCTPEEARHAINFVLASIEDAEQEFNAAHLN